MGLAPAQLWAMGNEQIDILLASWEVEQDTGQHGQFMSEATSPDADPNNYDGAYRYVAHVLVDQAERAVINKRKELQTQLPDADLSDLRFVVEKVEYGQT